MLSIVRTKRQLLKFSILDLTVNNIFRAYDDVQSKKNHEELIIHFQNIENLLTQQKEELKSINEEIKLLRMTVGYAQHEENIKDGLFVLNEYLGQPDDMYSRNSFFEEARKLLVRNGSSEPPDATTDSRNKWRDYWLHARCATVFSFWFEFTAIVSLGVRSVL